MRKITIDNSVKYVPITEKDKKQNTTENKEFNLFQEEVNKTKNFKKNKKFVKDFTASGFAILTK